MKVFIVGWEYSDKSGHGIVGVFSAESEANSTYDLLAEHGSDVKTFTVDTYPVISTCQEILP